MILGAVFAGGVASRFGSDKALALHNGKPLIEHVATVVARHCDRVVICGRDHAPWPGLVDRPRAGLGPLGALAAALTNASANGFARVLTAPCDVPTIADATFGALIDTPGAAYLTDCPLIAIWPATLAAALDDHLAQDGDRAMVAWARWVRARPLDLPAPPNVNRPADLPSLA